MTDERVAGGMTDGEEPTDPASNPQPSDAEDTEGQSMAALLAMRELTGRPRRQKATADEALPPLTKKFPRMRDDSRK